MMPTTQITQANFAYDNFSLGIYSSRNADTAQKSFTPFGAKPMMINHDTNSITGSYIRDIDFSFTVKNGTTFEVGLFLYNPKYMKISTIRDHYKKEGVMPNNFEHFHHIGLYTIHFDVNNMNENDINRNHFTFEQASDANRNPIKFDFYFMHLDANKYDYIAQGRNDIYYLSNPFVTFNPNQIQ
jgi:hypothetical protein